MERKTTTAERATLIDKVHDALPMPVVRLVYRFIGWVWIAFLPVILLVLPVYYAALWAFAAKARRTAGQAPALDAGEQGGMRLMFDALFPKWGRFPMSLVTKFQESLLFSQEPLEGPSVEIGCQKGEHSRILFQGKRIDWAIEYSPRVMAGFLPEAELIFARKACADSYALPLPDRSLGTVLLVNSIDDFQRGAESALEEFSRVLQAGGKVVFSGFAETFFRRSVFNRLDPGGARFKKAYPGLHNFYDREEWESLAHRFGLELERFVYLVPARLFRPYELAYFLETVLMNRLRFWHGMVFMQLPLLRRVYRDRLFRLCLRTLAREGGEERGALFFAVARKPGQSPGAKPPELACPLCIAPLDAVDPVLLRCPECGAPYPLVDRVPVVHPEFASWNAPGARNG